MHFRDRTNEQLKKLAKIIRENKGCIATVDNDSWRIEKPLPAGSEHWSDAHFDAWYSGDDDILADWKDFPALNNVYGGAILEALAFMQGMIIRQP